MSPIGKIMAQVPESFGTTQGFRTKHVLADEDFDTEDEDKKAEIAKRRHDIE